MFTDISQETKKLGLELDLTKIKLITNAAESPMQIKIGRGKIYNNYKNKNKEIKKGCSSMG